MTVVYSSSTTNGTLPFYTPPAIAESVTNPYVAPPLIENNPTVPVATSHVPVLTAAMQAVNSLTDEYSEPMELAPSTSGSVSEADVSSPSNSKKQKTMEECVAACTSIVEAAVVEMRENKSADNLSDIVVKLEQNGEIGKKSCFANGPASLTDEMSMMADECRDILTGGRIESSVMQIDKEDESTPPTLNRADLELLCELFYLPFEHGPRANFLIEEFLWLKNNAYVVRQSKECLTSKLVRGFFNGLASFIYCILCKMDVRKMGQG